MERNESRFSTNNRSRKDKLSEEEKEAVFKILVIESPREFLFCFTEILVIYSYLIEKKTYLVFVNRIVFLFHNYFLSSKIIDN